LERGTTGKLPKAFKVIPALANWEEILYLTRPDKWSGPSIRAATRIFASNLNSKLAQRFYNMILLPRIRDEIQNTKKLNFHVYLALKKTLYKPAAFFKGILLPLCEEGNCSLREADIIGSVIIKVSVPVLQSSVALLKLADMEYSGTNSVFIRILIEKKYALPYRVVDGLVAHFMRFASDERQMPLVWHRSLLSFAQRYKSDVTEEQKEALKHLLKKQFHDKMTPEIRRELFNSPSRGEGGTIAVEPISTKMSMAPMHVDEIQ